MVREALPVQLAALTNSSEDRRWSMMSILYARVALGSAFLSAVAARFGLWDRSIGWERFGVFVQYTAEVNSFMPTWTIPFLAWGATGAELALGTALVTGLWLRATALASAVLLAIFGTAMALSFGIKSPLDYSVFSASAAALLLADHQWPMRRRNGKP